MKGQKKGLPEGGERITKGGIVFKKKKKVGPLTEKVWCAVGSAKKEESNDSMPSCEMNHRKGCAKKETLIGDSNIDFSVLN